MHSPHKQCWVSQTSVARVRNKEGGVLISQSNCLYSSTGAPWVLKLTINHLQLVTNAECEGRSGKKATAGIHVSERPIAAFFTFTISGVRNPDKDTWSRVPVNLDLIQVGWDLGVTVLGVTVILPLSDCNAALINVAARSS